MFNRKIKGSKSKFVTQYCNLSFNSYDEPNVSDGLYTYQNIAFLKWLFHNLNYNTARGNVEEVGFSYNRDDQYLPFFSNNGFYFFVKHMLKQFKNNFIVNQLDYQTFFDAFKAFQKFSTFTVKRLRSKSFFEQNWN